MTPRAAQLVAAVAAVAAVMAWMAPAAAARPLVRAHPGLKPDFALGTLDYTVRCHPGKPVTFDVRPPDGVEAAFDRGRAHRAAFSASADLVPGSAAELRLRQPGHARTYRFRCLPSDFPHFRVHRAARPQARWYAVGADRRNPAHPGYAIVFDSRGVPVWWMRRSPAPFDVDVLPNGHLVWTNYVALSPDSGGFTEWTLAGRAVRTWSTVDTPTNQHDLQFLPNGNALMIAYRRRDGVDLRRWGGPAHAAVLDGEIQELDPAGRLVWRWNTKDHIALRETGRWLRSRAAHPRMHTADGRPLYDLVHLNSVEPDGERVVFSARYLDAVYAIDRASGSVLWKLGGTRTEQSLTIEGDSEAPRDFGGQHDARILEGGLLTLHDNGVQRDRPSRSLAFKLDLEDRRARLFSAVDFPKAGPPGCCGSSRRLPGGNWVTWWGGSEWMTEQTARGSLVLSIRLLDGYTSYRGVPVVHGGPTRRSLASGMMRQAPGPPP
jgi:Arylsulfotransferase (ASST)